MLKMCSHHFKDLGAVLVLVLYVFDVDFGQGIYFDGIYLVLWSL